MAEITYNFFFLNRVNRRLPLVDKTPEGENLVDLLTQSGGHISDDDSDILEAMEDLDSLSKTSKSRVDVVENRILPPEMPIAPKMDWFILKVNHY